MLDTDFCIRADRAVLTRVTCVQLLTQRREERRDFQRNSSLRPLGVLGVDSNRLTQKAAIYSYVCARDETAGRVAGQEDCRTDQFLRFAKTIHGRMSPNRPGAICWRTIVFEQEFAVLLRRKETGRDGVHTHAFGRPFTR